MVSTRFPALRKSSVMDRLEGSISSVDVIVLEAWDGHGAYLFIFHKREPQSHIRKPYERQIGSECIELTSESTTAAIAMFNASTIILAAKYWTISKQKQNRSSLENEKTRCLLAVLVYARICVDYELVAKNS
jgi:hypothetical protein